MARHPPPVELIEVLEADPDAFGSVRPSADARQPPSKRSVVGAAIAVVVMTAATVAIVRPWDHGPEWRRYPTPTVDPTLTDLLVLDKAPAPLVSAIRSVQDDPAAPDAGYLFASPGARPNSGRWVLFRIEPTPGTTAAKTAATATLATAQNGVLLLQWADAAGTWTVTSHGVGEQRTREFAQALSWRDGAPAVASALALGDLEPVGSVAGYDAAQQLVFGVGQAGLPDSVTVAYYRAVRFPTAVASTPAPADAARMVRFFLFGTPTDVRGELGVLANSLVVGRVLAWVEGGRLIMVVGSQDPDTLHTLAESVEPAGIDTPWKAGASGAAVVASTTTTVPVGSGTTSDGVGWSVSARFGTVTVICATVDALRGTVHPESVCTADAHATLAELFFITTSVGTIVVAVSNSPAGATVRLVDVGGTTSFLPLRPLVWDLSAVAFLPSAGAGFALGDPKS